MQRDDGDHPNKTNSQGGTIGFKAKEDCGNSTNSFDYMCGPMTRFMTKKMQ